MTLIKSGILFASVASLLALIACNSADSVSGTAPAREGVAATVNGVPISEHLVGGMLNVRAGLGREASPDARNELIGRLARQLMIVEAAVKKGLDKQPDVVDKLELARLSVLTDAFVQDYLKSNPVSDDDLKTEYEKFRAQQTGTEYKAKHILVDNEADAKAIIAKLKVDPKDFDGLAKGKSKDDTSKASGGDLGWFDARAVAPEFGVTVTQLTKGKFTEAPVKTKYGYHVILLEDTRPKAIPALEQIKPQFIEQVKQQRLAKVIDDLKAQAKIVVAPAPASASAPKPAENKAETKAVAPTEPAKK